MSEPVRLWKIQSIPSQFPIISLPLPAGVCGLDEAAGHLPAGAYTTFRTYSGRCVLRLEDHFIRLENSAALAGVPVSLDRNLIRLALRSVLQQLQSRIDMRVRLVVDLQNEPGATFIAAEEFVGLPEEVYNNGVKVVTCILQRQTPKAKLTRFIAHARKVRRGKPADANEAIMLDDKDNLLEGLTSNFFGVRRGVLYTAFEGVLDGLTRSLALEEAMRLDVPLCQRPVKLLEVKDLQEAFITSASRAVLPVSQIDRCLVGNGKPGLITRRLADAYRKRLQIECEPL